MGLVGGIGAQAVDEAVLEVVGQLHAVRIGNRAVLLGQLGVAFGIDPVVLAVIDDPVGLQDPALIVELDVPARFDGVLVAVVDHLVRLDEQAVLLGLAAGRLLDEAVVDGLGHGGMRT